MRVKGSITIWGSITVMLVSQVLFLFLEAGRKVELGRMKQLEVNQNLESVFSAYEIPLWDRYQLLGWDETKIPYEEILNMSAINTGVESKSDLLKADLSENYQWKRTLLTDQEGLAYKSAVVAYMKENWVYEAMDQIFTNSENIEKLEEESGGSMDYYLGPVQDSLKNIEEWNKKNANGGGHSVHFQTSSMQEADSSNDTITCLGPLNMMSSIMKNGLLGILIMDKVVSKNDIGASNRITKRSLCEGDYGLNTSGSITDRVYYLSYLFTRFGDYTNVQDQTAMEYELEYLLSGFSKDNYNLDAAVARLLLLREASNVISICQDSVKVNEADSYGLLLASLIMMPELKDAFKWAIVCSWAFAESILDIRSLLVGEKIPMIKNADQWTISSFLLSEIYVYGGMKAKSCQTGLVYSDYIKAFLVLTSDRNLAMRAMELQEKTIQQIEGYEDFKMDHIVIQSQVDCEYSVKSIFLPLVMSLSSDRKKGYTIHCRGSYSYLQ